MGQPAAGHELRQSERSGVTAAPAVGRGAGQPGQPQKGAQLPLKVRLPGGGARMLGREVQRQRGQHVQRPVAAQVLAVEGFHSNDADDQPGGHAIVGLCARQRRAVFIPKANTGRDAPRLDEPGAVGRPVLERRGRRRQDLLRGARVVPGLGNPAARPAVVPGLGGIDGVGQGAGIRALGIRGGRGGMRRPRLAAREGRCRRQAQAGAHGQPPRGTQQKAPPSAVWHRGWGQIAQAAGKGGERRHRRIGGAGPGRIVARRFERREPLGPGRVHAVGVVPHPLRDGHAQPRGGEGVRTGHAGAFPTPGRLGQQPVPTVHPRPAPEQGGHADRRHGGEHDAQQPRRILPARRRQPQPPQQIELTGGAVVQYPVVPALVGRVPDRAHALQQGRIDPHHGGGDEPRGRAQPLAGRGAVGADIGGGVDAHPAGVRQPDFGPGVGVALPHRPPPVDGVVLPTLVAGYHPRRDVQRAQGDDEGRGNVFTKTRPPVEPEFVRGVAAIDARLQRVAVAALAQVAQDGFDQDWGGGLAQLAPQRVGPCQRPGVVARRQFPIHMQRLARGVGAAAVRGVGHGLVAQHVGDRARQPPLPVRRRLGRQPPHTGAGRGDHRGRGGGFQCQQPGAQAGLHRHLVAQAGAGGLKAARRVLLQQHGGHAAGCIRAVQRSPAPAIEHAQHRPAKIQRLARGRPVGKGHPQRNPLIQRQLGHIAHLHLPRQPAAADGAVGGDAPQRGQAGKQREQQRHDRRARQRHAARCAGRLPQWRAAVGQVGQHQRGQQAPHRQTDAQRRQQRLRAQQRRPQREEPQKKDHVGVAPGAHLQRLERQQHDDERDAGLGPQQGAVAAHRQACGRHG